MFKYLGSWFRSDGDQKADIRARIAAANATAGKMRQIWASRTIPLRLKLRIYSVGVCSKLTYGSEAWRLDEKACAMLNGANSLMVSHITGRPARVEASRYTRTVDIVRIIRARRLKWLGHILRLGPDRMIHRAARHVAENRSEGDLLMDVPKNYSWEELKQLAGNRDYWRLRVKALREGSGVKVSINGPPPSPRKRKASPLTTADTKTTTTRPTAASTAAKAAKRYRTRDAHTAFFRPCTGSPRKRKRNTRRTKPKPRELTNKERQAAARDHWDLNHGFCQDMPEVLGHMAGPSPGPDHPNQTMAPLHFESLIEYFDNETLHHNNLKNLSELMDSSF